MSDRKIIYLDDAIDAIYKCTDYYIGNLPIMIDKADAYKALDALPPAQQENDWTPVSKKKHPDKEGEYLVTDDAGGMATVDKDTFMFLDDGTPCWLYSQNVTAWRELPEPYKERMEK